MPLADRRGDDVFYEAPRTCARAEVVPHPDPITRPEKVRWSSVGVEEFHRCPDGAWGRLTLLHPEPPGPDPIDVKVRGEEGPNWPPTGGERF